uniref:Uncharacterized protein n=1 Tax=Glycine max TaxID=3847 RepID=A0A0R0HNH0_SOYBN
MVEKFTEFYSKLAFKKKLSRYKSLHLKISLTKINLANTHPNTLNWGLFEFQFKIHGKLIAHLVPSSTKAWLWSPSKSNISHVIFKLIQLCSSISLLFN